MLPWAQAAGRKRRTFLLRDPVGIRLNRPEGTSNDRAAEPLRTSTTRRRVRQGREGAERLRRNFYTTSSCGVCGKASIEAIQVRGISPVLDDGFVVDGEVLGGLAEALRGAQAIFDKTGGLHAAALFEERGRLVSIREDVGRHNAVDKLIGHAFLNHRPPLSRHLMMVSGRASFEITQKAAAAGLPVVAAISAPSSLACDVARAFGMTLVGFMRGDRFTVYTGAQRIRHRGQTVTGVD